VKAETINFNDILNKTLQSAHEINIAKADEQISYANKWEMSSAFYPRFSLNYRAEYLYDYGNKPGSAFIDGQYYSDATQWQTSFSIAGEYDIFNPSATLGPYLLAGDNYLLQKLNTKVVEKNTVLNLVSLYETALSAYRSAGFYDEMHSAAIELYNVQKRLHEVGLVDKQVFYMSGIEAAEYATKKIDSNLSLSAALGQLGYFTGEKYSIDSEVGYFDEYIEDTLPPPVDHPEIAAAAAKIRQKNTEIYFHDLTAFPTISIFANYGFYGYNRSVFEEAVKDLELKNYTVGVSVSYTIFSGLSFFHTKSRLKAENYKLMLERTQLMQQIITENDRLINSKRLLDELKRSSQELDISLTDVLSMGEALRGANLIGAAELLRRKIDILESRLEQEQQRIRFSAEAARIHVINIIINGK
jgi:outer membrane protein TolC